MNTLVFHGDISRSSALSDSEGFNMTLQCIENIVATALPTVAQTATFEPD
ncbi:MAG TPA: hypothetical protein VFO07_10185 [Roseiflexaceae bacterium]|nr:hypothetical protein [Roseiflexaceae bacterium]